MDTEIETEIKTTEVKHNIQILVKKEVDDKIRWFTHNYEEEIGAFLTGEVKDGNIIIDGLLFPHQDVTSGSVDTDAKNLVRLRKEYGDECLRIIGHWHSHNTMGAFWSGTDDTFMETYSKTKDVSVFFVSSKNSRHRTAVVLNKPFEMMIDNLGYEVEWNNEAFEDDLRKIIKDKVERKAITQVYSHNNSWQDQGYGHGISNSDKAGDMAYNSVRFNAEIGQVIAMDLTSQQATSLVNSTKGYAPRMKMGTSGMFEVTYKTGNKKKGIKLFKEIKIYIEEIFEEDIVVYDSYNNNDNFNQNPNQNAHGMEWWP